MCSRAYRLLRLGRATTTAVSLCGRAPLSTVKLHAIGKLQPARVDEQYEPAQCFIHKTFAYRGLVLFAWTTEVHEQTRRARSVTNYGKPTGGGDATDAAGSSTATGELGRKPIAPATETYYQALIHVDDWKHIQILTESITFISQSGGPDGGPVLAYVEGLDNVSHSDMIPFQATVDPPVNHKLFHHWFNEVQEKGVRVWRPNAQLDQWRERQMGSLQASHVYKETTPGPNGAPAVRITVIPFYIGPRPQANGDPNYWWRYTLRLENLTPNEELTVRAHNLKVYSQSGTLHIQSGRGLNNREPLLTPAKRVYQVTSHVSLNSTRGHCWGTLQMEGRGGRMMEANIPTFHLDAVVDR